MPFWKKKPGNGDTPQPGADTNAGSPKVAGDIRSSGARKATVLRSKEIGLAVVGAALFVAAIFYLVVSHVWSGNSSSSTAQNAAGKAPAIGIPPVSALSSQISAPSTPANPSQPSSNKQPPVKNMPPASPAPATTAPQKTPQEKALSSALSGGSSVVSWSTNNNQKQQEAKSLAPAVVVQPSQGKEKKKAPSVYSSHMVRREVSPYELLQGTVIPAVLETGIKSDIPGEMTAIVRNPVYSSVSGADVLIPAGSKLVGTYDSHVIAGATRVAVDWTRVEFPNGTYINLGSGMPGASSSGYSGFHDLVNNHTWSIFRSALLLSIIDAGMAVSSPQQTATANGIVTGNVALADAEQGLAQTFGEAEAQLLQREINIAPTLTIPTGYPFNVVVTKDLVFPGPYQPGTSVEPQPVEPVAGPTTIDRYGGA